MNLFPLIPTDIEEPTTPMARFTRGLIWLGLVSLPAQLWQFAHSAK
jgi:hypothetical protein